MIYLLHGSDAFTRTMTLASFKAAFPPDALAFNLVTLDGRTAKMNDIRTACEAYPMLHDRRLVIVHDVLKYAKSQEARDGLRVVLKHVPPSTDLVLNENDTLDARLAVVKDLQQLAKTKQAEIREYVAPEGAALNQWINKHVQANQASITPLAVQILSDYVGNDLWLLHNEIVKLATFVGVNGTIDEKTIQKLVSDEAETNLFSFIDAVSNRRSAEANTLLYSLLLDGAAPLYIIAMLARQARLMLAANSAGKVAPDTLASLLGQKPFVARKASEQARHWTTSELNQLHQQILAVDHAIKTGVGDPEGMLTALVGSVSPKSR